MTFKAENYDLNNDRAPVLAVVAENDAGFGTPLAFGLSNKENNWTTSIALKSLKNNIPCDDLPDEKATENVLDRTILCWFHITQTFRENSNNWKVPWPLKPLRYMIDFAQNNFPKCIALKNLGPKFSRNSSIKIKRYTSLLVYANHACNTVTL
ncbi:hypothetical protein GLOIN_2v1796283 [Rhizophagus clarus]|uniref:Uncharacterized protein n=1 Tax=Rhizophagus clarus TaxID=94130 RepID=A0A8H3LRV9_9GLOM|nr:hypothetical protein GLOIN_2v1796283 [Rhizophagus clarus]